MQAIGARLSASSRFEHFVFLDVPVDGHPMPFVQPADQFREFPELLVERYSDFVMEFVARGAEQFVGDALPPECLLNLRTQRLGVLVSDRQLKTRSWCGLERLQHPQKSDDEPAGNDREAVQSAADG